MPTCVDKRIIHQRRGVKVLFWGTPAYAVSTLNALINAGQDLVGVVTQPDRRRARGKQLIPSPVKQRALELGLPVFTPVNLRKEHDMQSCLSELQADISVVVAFGQILPREVLSQPPFGCWNGHGSLLPRWRGAGPIQWSLLSGDANTGVGIMAMEQGLDTGPVLLQESISIGLLENADQLANRLSALTARLMIEALPRIATAGSDQESIRMNRLKVIKQEQLPGEPTYARMLSKDDYILDWNLGALDIHRKVMGLYPNALTKCGGKRLKVQTTEPLIEQLRPHLSKDTQELLGRWESGKYQPGKVIAVESELGIVVSTNDWPILIREAQLEGKNTARGCALAQQLNTCLGSYLGDQIT